MEGKETRMGEAPPGAGVDWRTVSDQTVGVHPIRPKGNGNQIQYQQRERNREEQKEHHNGVIQEHTSEPGGGNKTI